MSRVGPNGHAVCALRITALTAAVLLSLLAGYAFLSFSAVDGLTAIDALRTGLVTITGFWLIWGAIPALLGLLVGRWRQPASRTPPRGQTIILVPVYNEDAEETFSRVAAMNRGLVRLGLAPWFDFAILSDSNDLSVAAQEALAYDRLMREPQGAGRIFYRRRANNTGKKAGNIEDFVRTSGGAYDYALILDADSLMSPQTMLAMARRMDDEPGLGLLQTVPRIIEAQTVFGRLMQFSSGYLSPVFARGAALYQGNEGPYWGHNAIVRMKAFAACCGLPTLSGKPPSGGHILSHDYVEAALLSRGGWRVAVDADLEGSFEHGPENLIEYAKRDRRWCQGNLQHRRLLTTPGLKLWSRFTLLQGIMAYVASPLWLALLLASVGAAMAGPLPALLGQQLHTIPVWALVLGVAVLLVAPKVLIWARGLVDRGNRPFGGSVRAGLSILAEIIVSTLLAPAMLMLQSRAVIQILLGRDGGWPATARASSKVDLGTAFAASWWIIATGAAIFALVWVFALDTLLWVLPASVPALFAPILIWASSCRGTRAWLFLTENERQLDPVIAEQRAILACWRGVGRRSDRFDAAREDPRHEHAYA